MNKAAATRWLYARVVHKQFRDALERQYLRAEVVMWDDDLVADMEFRIVNSTLHYVHLPVRLMIEGEVSD